VRAIPLAPQKGAKQRATVLLDADGRRAVIVGNGLVPQSGKDYELWVIKGEAKLPAGLLRAGADGRITVEVEPSALSQGVDAFAITLEAEGGAKSPLGPILCVGAVGKG
jgi:anti-sigma-K factor RskA